MKDADISTVQLVRVSSLAKYAEHDCRHTTPADLAKYFDVPQPHHLVA